MATIRPHCARRRSDTGSQTARTVGALALVGLTAALAGCSDSRPTVRHVGVVDTDDRTDGANDGDVAPDGTDTFDAICSDPAGCTDVSELTRVVHVSTYAGRAVSGAPVTVHGQDASERSRSHTDDSGAARVDWSPGDRITAPIFGTDPTDPDDPAQVASWVTVAGFDDVDELSIGRAAWDPVGVGSSRVSVANLEPGERVAVFNGCDATTLFAERPEAVFRWQDHCVSEGRGMLIATTTESLGSSIVSRQAFAVVDVGEDVVFDTWEPPTEVRVDVPASAGEIVEAAITVRYEGVPIRRFLATGSPLAFRGPIVGDWQLQLWTRRGDEDVYVVKDVETAAEVTVQEGELPTTSAAEVATETEGVRLSFVDDPTVALRSTYLVMGDVCTGGGYAQNVISDAGILDLLVPKPAEFAEADEPHGWIELVVRGEGVDPADAVFTLGLGTVYQSGNLVHLQEFGPQAGRTPVTATLRVVGEIDCH